MSPTSMSDIIAADLEAASGWADQLDALRALQQQGLLPGGNTRHFDAEDIASMRHLVPLAAARTYLADTSNEAARDALLAGLLAKMSAAALYTQAHTALRSHLHGVLPGFFAAHPAADTPAQPTAASVAEAQHLEALYRAIRGPEDMEGQLAAIRDAVLVDAATSEANDAPAHTNTAQPDVAAEDTPPDAAEQHQGVGPDFDARVARVSQRATAYIQANPEAFLSETPDTPAHSSGISRGHRIQPGSALAQLHMQGVSASTEAEEAAAEQAIRTHLQGDMGSTAHQQGLAFYRDTLTGNKSDS